MKKLRRQKSKASGKDSSPRNIKPLIIIGLILAAGYWYLQRDKTPVAPPKPLAAKSVEADPTVAPPRPIEYIPEPKSEPSQSFESLKNLRARAYTDSQLGLKSLKLTNVDGVFKIPFTFRAEKRWCQGGDLDTISFLKPDPNFAEFLITIETLTGKQRGDKMRVSSNALFAGFDKTFEIEIRRPTETLGLFICRDQAKTGSCRGKTLETHEAISAAIAENKTWAAAQAKDYQLYFQSFIVKNGELISFSNTSIGKEYTEKLRNHLNTEYGVSIPDFNAAWEITKVLRSVPADIQTGKIILSLPYNDPRCQPGQSSDEFKPNE